MLTSLQGQTSLLTQTPLTPLQEEGRLLPNDSGHYRGLIPGTRTTQAALAPLLRIRRISCFILVLFFGNHQKRTNKLQEFKKERLWKH